MSQDMEAMRAECATLRLLNSTLTGAAAGLLDAIHRAGGHHVYDPAHQSRIQTTLKATENAVVQNLEQREAMPVMSLVDYEDNA